jgi:hypothetical protein
VLALIAFVVLVAVVAALPLGHWTRFPRIARPKDHR